MIVKNIDSERIEEHLKQGKVVIVAGFQGYNKIFDILKIVPPTSAEIKNSPFTCCISVRKLRPESPILPAVNAIIRERSNTPIT